MRAAAGGVVALLLVLGGCTEAVPPATAVPPDLAALHARCVEQMIGNTCRAQAGRGNAAAPASGAPAPVFVAGIGAIDARAYDEIRSQGSAMCDTALQDCRADAASPRCVVAHQLWGR